MKKHNRRAFFGAWAVGVILMLIERYGGAL